MERDVERACRRHVEDDPLLQERLEPDTLEREVPDADGQHREPIGAVAGARLLPRQAGGVVDRGQRGAGHGPAPIVQHAALKGRARGLGGRRQRGHRERDSERERALESVQSSSVHDLPSWRCVRHSHRIRAIRIHFTAAVPAAECAPAPPPPPAWFSSRRASSSRVAARAAV